ncbi:MAG: carbonic anhydrase [Thermoleophilia bacterium]|nr:carbonic anhydrase [Thermoleophilia bacterium]
MTTTFDDVLDANRRYADQFDLGDLKAQAARGLAVLTCIDSRIEPLTMLGIHAGDAKILRNAGARVTDDALRSLVIAANVLGVRRIMVVAHTDCAMAATTDEELRTRLAERFPTADLGSIEFFTSRDQLGTLEADVERLRSCPLLPDDVEIGGFRYDVTTGLLEQLIH